VKFQLREPLAGDKKLRITGPIELVIDYDDVDKERVYLWAGFITKSLNEVMPLTPPELPRW
jgi:hypothetical protein